jgi:hypothetical protein
VACGRRPWKAPVAGREPQTRSYQVRSSKNMADVNAILEQIKGLTLLEAAQLV